MSQSGMTQEQAVEAARQAASADYPDLDAFEVGAEETDSEWRVNFSNPDEESLGARQHFSVSIDKRTGECKLFKGR